MGKYVKDYALIILDQKLTFYQNSNFYSSQKINTITILKNLPWKHNSEGETWWWQDYAVEMLC